MIQYDKKRKSTRTLVQELDDQLDQLAGVIIAFLQSVDEEDELHKLVEKLCGHDLEIMDKLCFAVDSHIIDTDYETLNIVPSESEYAH